MPSLLKKKSEADVPLVPPWHPNFRNFERLPDTKVVRTAFFINTVAVTIALALLIYVGSYEWRLHTLRVQIAEQQQQIDRDKAASDSGIAQYKKFQAEQAKLNEVDSFVKSKATVSQVLMHLGETIPKNIALDRFELRSNGLMLAATVRGPATQASDLVQAYIEQLKADKELAIFDDLQQQSFGKHPQSGRVMVELFLHLKGTEGKK
jgi:hypothetical protein